MFEQLVFHAEGKNGDAVDAAFDHSADGEFHALGIVNRGGEQNFVVFFDRQGLEGLHNFGEKRIGKLGDDQSKNATAAGNEGASTLDFHGL